MRCCTQLAPGRDRCAIGRVVVAAKGAKRPTSNLRAVLMPFQRINVAFGRSARDDAASDIHNLRGAEWGGGAPTAGGEALLAGFYLNELVMKLLARDDPHPALWDAYAATLPHLGGAEESAALRAVGQRQQGGTSEQHAASQIGRASRR